MREDGGDPVGGPGAQANNETAAPDRHVPNKGDDENPFGGGGGGESEWSVLARERRKRGWI